MVTGRCTMACRTWWCSRITMGWPVEARVRWQVTWWWQRRHRRLLQQWSGPKSHAINPWRLIKGFVSVWLRGEGCERGCHENMASIAMVDGGERAKEPESVSERVSEWGSERESRRVCMRIHLGMRRQEVSSTQRPCSSACGGTCWACVLGRFSVEHVAYVTVDDFGCKNK